MPSETVNHGDNTRARCDEAREEDAHLDDVDDGCGCVEVWEELTERRGDTAGE